MKFFPGAMGIKWEVHATLSPQTLQEAGATGTLGQLREMSS